MKITSLITFAIIMAQSLICTAQWNTNGSSILYTYDKVGVYTNNPTSRFQVRSGISKFSAGTAYSSSLGWGTSYIGFNAARSGSNWYFNGDGSNNGGSAIYGTVSGAIYFACKAKTGGSNTTISDNGMKNNVKMKVFSDGKIQMGNASTSDNDYVLFVSKGIKTGRVKTDASLADYVFADDYELMPLSEVEAYIVKNKHLPGVISDKEVQENDGVELTSFTISLQEKLEELYLHVIELEKELSLLKMEK